MDARRHLIVTTIICALLHVTPAFVTPASLWSPKQPRVCEALSAGCAHSAARARERSACAAVGVDTRKGPKALGAYVLPLSGVPPLALTRALLVVPCGVVLLSWLLGDHPRKHSCAGTGVDVREGIGGGPGSSALSPSLPSVLCRQQKHTPRSHAANPLRTIYGIWH